MVVPDLTEKALLKGINIDTANVAANTAGILVEMKSQKKSENIFCKDKKLLGTVCFARDSSYVTEKIYLMVFLGD